MPAQRAAAAARALEELRRRIAHGGYPSEARLPAAELGAEFGLSPTPMREVLSRLTGEGLLEERRGQGFFLRRLSARDIADLYRLVDAHLKIALGTLDAPSAMAQLAAATTDEGCGGEAPDDPIRWVAASERQFHRWVIAGAGRALGQSFVRVQAQLGRARRLEPKFLDDLAAEWSALCEQRATPAAAARLRAFFGRRIRLAGALADALEAQERRVEIYER